MPDLPALIGWPAVLFVAGKLLDSSLGWVLGERPLESIVRIMATRLGIGSEPNLEIRLCEPLDQAKEQDVWWGHLEIENTGLSKRVKHAKTAEHARVFAVLSGKRHELMWQSTTPQREISLIHKNAEKIPLVIWVVGLGLGWLANSTLAYFLTNRTFLVDHDATEAEIPPGDHDIEIEVIWGDGQRKSAFLSLHLPAPSKPPPLHVPQASIEFISKG